MKKIFSLAVICLISFTLVTPTFAFNDVPKTHSNYEDIMYLLNNGIIEDSAAFGVKEIVTREEVAIMIAKAKGLNSTPVDTDFSDVKKTNKNSGYIQAAKDLGIINGYEDGTFRPNAKVTRGHMAAFISRAFDLPTGTKTFKDVPVNHTAYVAVSELAAANITTGYEDGTFKPQNNLTRAHIVAFLARTVKYTKGIAPISPTPAPTKPAPAPTKPTGDINSGTYVIPGAPTGFKNCTALREYYPSGVQKGHPAYDTKHDRDKDNWACEK
ncbi:S-layer homology domain-containing protein [Caryophanon tenue]|uniref:SLH domain-containing protein n=1 Tax=Caryophanon tenue TaxID=33978 RepID=A0A1C0YMM7_9BACL|nr:S-layer homology domain-containing protein [Caryophanon tenue]OCS88408.1 hypothetical protein A6M13_00755 [Caryophanon tenue]